MNVQPGDARNLSDIGRVGHMALHVQLGSRCGAPYDILTFYELLLAVVTEPEHMLATSPKMGLHQLVCSHAAFPCQWDYQAQLKTPRYVSGGDMSAQPRADGQDLLLCHAAIDNN